MEYKGITFGAIVATPGAGKSYLCDKYPEKFADADEVRLRIKYFVPDGITRAELEDTKGERTFARRFSGSEYISALNEKLDKEVSLGKILICSPHPELIDYLKSRGIKFCLVYQAKDMREELKKRMEQRGNRPKVVKENYDLFDDYYIKNTTETDSAVRYEFTKNEYLEDIIIKHFGLEL